MKLSTAMLLSLALAGVVACDDSTAAPGAPSPSGATPRAASAPADAAWQSAAQAEVDALRTAEPTRYAAIKALRPVKTRAGALRLVGEALHDPAAAAVLVGWLADGEPDAQLRAAIVDALPRTGGAYGDALVGLLATEQDADVRVVMLASLQHAEANAAEVGLHAGLVDADPAVRAEAARVAGMRADGANMAGALVTALADEAPSVRAAAARTAGILKLASATAALPAGLKDADAEVRLQTLRALHRIDPALVQGRPALATLQADGDPRVAAAATRIATP